MFVIIEILRKFQNTKKGSSTTKMISSTIVKFFEAVLQQRQKIDELEKET